MTEIDKILEKEFEKRKFKIPSRNAYKKRLNELFQFYEHVDPKQITFDQIDTYIFRKRKASSPSEIRTAFWAIKLLYNEVLGLNYPLYRIKLPDTDSTLPNLLTQDEIKMLLSNIENHKQRTIFTVLYATGMHYEELQKLEPKDILSEKSKIRIHNNKTGKIRYAHLSDKLLKILREYYKQYNPKKLLFEGQKAGTQYSITSMRKVLIKALSKSEIKTEITLKEIRYCYVLHLVEQGESLPAILKNLQITSLDTVEFYYKLCGKKEEIRTTPLDKLGVILNINSFDTEKLEALFEKIENLDERDYLRESIACFKVGAIRAGIVYVWASAIRNLQNKCERKGYKGINEALFTLNPKAKRIKSISDFETLKDKTTLEIALRTGVISKHEKSELEKHLDLRNYCGHPSDYYPDDNKVKAYLEDIINIILKKG